MPSIAWSTVAVLALLLPGFFFFTGLYTPESFSRDLAPRNPLGTLAAVVLVSITTHSVCSGVSAFAGTAVDWAATLSAVQLSPPAGPRSAAGAFTQHPWRITAYVLSTSAAGLLCGAVAGVLVVGVKLRGKVRAPLRFLAQHRWVYELDPGRARTIPYVHVLADISHDGRVIIYRGRLEGFGIGHDGAFTYLIISGVQQRFLRLDHKDAPGGEVPHTGPLARIGTRATDPARLVIAGAAIKDVVFQGVAVQDLREATPVANRFDRMADRVAAGVLDRPGELQEIRALIREVDGSTPTDAETAPVTVLENARSAGDERIPDGGSASANEET